MKLFIPIYYFRLSRDLSELVFVKSALQFVSVVQKPSDCPVIQNTHARQFQPEIAWTHLISLNTHWQLKQPWKRSKTTILWCSKFIWELIRITFVQQCVNFMISKLLKLIAWLDLMARRRHMLDWHAITTRLILPTRSESSKHTTWW